MRKEKKWELAFFIALLVIMGALFAHEMLYYCVRATRFLSIDYNEGWNLFHTTDFIKGRNLYQPVTAFPYVPVNYPPLSFLVTALLQKYAGILLIGRLLSLVSFIGIGALIYLMTLRLTGRWEGAIVAAYAWFALMFRFSQVYIGMFDPQMLGHLPALSALFFYFLWREKLTLAKITGICMLITCSLAIKHIFLVVPLCIGLDMLLSRPRYAWIYAAVLGACIVGAGLLIVVYSNGHFFENFFDLGRNWAVNGGMSQMKKLFYPLVSMKILVFFFPLFFVVFMRQREYFVCIYYYLLSLAFGIYTSRAVGIDVNVWFDLFIASALLIGLTTAAIADFLHRGPQGTVAAAAFLIVLVVLDGYAGVRLLSALKEAPLRYAALSAQEQTFRRDIDGMRQVSGPALFENLLVGFYAGKELLFDPFLGSQTMANGALSEKPLLERIERGYFKIIALNFDIASALERMPSERWTDNTLRSIMEHYRKLDLKGTSMHYYVPAGEELRPVGGER